MKGRLISLLMLIPALLSGQVIFDKPLSERITGYDINATLDPVTHIVTASMKAWWVNKSEKPVSQAMMHMYLNAFSSNNSTFSVEGDWAPKGDDGWGWVKITAISDNFGNDLSNSMKFVAPDDGNTSDRTVLQLSLPEPVSPGDTLKLELSFKSKLPSPIERTGFAGDYYFVAQWFPKFGVYETAGMRQRETDGWNCHQFHRHSEFYSNHSVYNVSVTLPSDYVAGSGGMLIDETDNGDGTKKIRWRAEDIVDFAWTAWPGYKIVKRNWRGVEITLLTSEQGLKTADGQFAALMNALEYLSARVGPYPWPHLTFVDPPLLGLGAGGMEYTTLFTTLGGGWLPKFYKLPETTTIHEFGHAYFMGILASNEFEEPWLDEGVNSYWEQRMADDFYGDGYGMIRLPFLKLSDTDDGRKSYISSPDRNISTNDLPSWMYPHGTYFMMSYNKTAVWLQTLEGLISTETMDNVFREYYRRWAFRHPSGRDFIAVVNDVVRNEHGDLFGENMNWYFDQVLYGNGICDYRVAGITNRKIRGYSGISDNDSVNYIHEDGKNDTLYYSRVGLERIGDVMLPVEILIHFANGDEVLEKWDGKARYRDLEYTGKSRVEWAEIDPHDKIDMDVNRINNSWSGTQKFPASRRMADKFITLIQIMISIFTI